MIIHDSPIAERLIKRVVRKLKIPPDAIKVSHINNPPDVKILITMGLFCTKHFLPSTKCIGDVKEKVFEIKYESNDYYCIPSYDAHYIVNNSVEELESLYNCFHKAKELLNVVY